MALPADCRYPAAMNRNERRKLAKQQRRQAAAGGQVTIDTSSLLATAQQQLDQGLATEAEATCQKILSINPSEAKALQLLGLIAYLGGELKIAIDWLKKATKIRPNFAEAFYNLGIVLNRADKAKQAETAYRQAIKIKPENVDYLNNLGNLLVSRKNSEQALEIFQQALDIDPDHLKILNNYGSALAKLGRHEEAIAHYKKALAIEPNYSDAYNNLGNAYVEEGQLSAAIEGFEKAIELQPDNARMFNNLGNALLDSGEPKKAREAYQKSVDLAPEQPRTHSNLLYCYQYDPHITAHLLNDYHRAWDKNHGAPQKAKWPSHKISKNSDRRLRLGFASPDFGRHPVGFFLIKLLENIEAKDFEIYCYSDRLNKDDMTNRLAGASRQWQDSFNLDDDALAAKIRSDKIDILFELSGHTKGNRLSMHAQKPAPVQISWGIGYPGTTGLSTIDILLTDVYHVAPAEDDLYPEKVVRLPAGLSCYEPPSYAPAVGELPANQNGYVTFGSFSQSRKITGEVLAAWASILAAVPDSRILLKYSGLDDEFNIKRIESAFAGEGIKPDRIIIEGGAPHKEFLARYNAVDIGLDTFPYSGGITTCEALWMGVHVVTLPGTTSASRHASSHLSTVGLTKYIAGDLPAYVNIATELAKDLSELKMLRQGLRDRVAGSPLCDGAAFARQFGAAMRDIWQNQR
jgi:protein O-GlcNAc transferase